MPLVSVVMPAYNHEKYVSETIESVLSQTFQDFEFIIVNNGSTDKTAEKIQAFDDPRIQLVHFDINRGGVPATNHALSLAKGKYIAMLCSDDLFLPDKLQKQVDFLESHADIHAVFSRVIMINENSENFSDKKHFYAYTFDQQNRSRHEWLNYFFNTGNGLCLSSALIHRSVFEQIGYYNPCYYQLTDLDLWIRLCLKYEVHVLQERLTKFRVRDNEMNASGNTIQNYIRIQWEQRSIIKNYFGISSISELLSVFPKLKSQYSENLLVNNLIPYYIAQLCLEKDATAYHACALETLEALLQTAEPALLKNFNFSYPEFFRLIGEKDIFNLKGRRFQLSTLLPRIKLKISRLLKARARA